MAFEAAEAGIEWALAMLNGGRIGSDCTEASAVATSTSFRQQYLIFDDDGKIIARRQTTDPTRPLVAMCVWSGAAWICDCPTDAKPAIAAPLTPGLHPAFAVYFTPDPAPAPPAPRVAPIGARPGVVRISVNGCVSMTEACLLDFSDLPQQSEGRAQHSTLAVLKPALTTPPRAAVTVYGNANGLGSAIVQNTDDKAGGFAVHAAGGFDRARFTLTGPSGTPIDRLVSSDDAVGLIPSGLNLASLLGPPTIPLNWNRVFGSVFGLMPETYQQQPAAAVLNCPNTGCTALLSAWVAANPGRVIWIPGDLNLDAPILSTVGSLPNAADPTVPGPAVIVVDGRVNFLAPGVNIFGVVYARSSNWAGQGTITGAALIEQGSGGSFPPVAAQPTVIYNDTIVKASRLNSGSFVPLQGDWRDFIK